MSRKVKRASGGHIQFWCPGCDQVHAVNGTWKFNGSDEKPTLEPSIKVTGVKDFDDPTPTCCHSYVTDGRIAFLPDCTHALKGQTVDLPEWPYE